MRWRRLTLRCLVFVTRAAWQAVLGTWQHASSQIAQTECTHSPEHMVRRANQWAWMDVCDKKRGRCGTIMNYYATAAADAKAKAKEKGKIGATFSQRAARVVSGGSVEEDWDNACPRCNRELYIFNTASGPIMRCRGWDLAGRACTLIKACERRAVNRVVNPGRSWSTKHTGGGSFPTGSGGPSVGSLPKQTGGAPSPPLGNDWTVQMQALVSNPEMAHEQFAQWQLLHQHFQHNQYQPRRRPTWSSGKRSRFPTGTAGPLGTSRAWIRERVGRPFHSRAGLMY